MAQVGRTILDEMIALRRDLHAHPELGFEEFRTSSIIAEALAAEGIAVTTGVGRTGVVGTLKRGTSGRAIMLRADMDALAMPETAEDRPWRSTQSGKMHACGHDGHTAMLLGAAQHLSRNGRFDGTAHFVFQPAEEGRGGAQAMVDDGFFARFPVDRAFGLHNMPGLAVDEMAVVTGPQLASSDRFQVTFCGKGTHGAKPHLGRDPVAAAGQFLAAVHTIVARELDPLEPGVVSICAMEAGDFAALNVIPDSARLGGTARAYSTSARDKIEASLQRLGEGIAASMGMTSAFEYRRGMPSVTNDPAATLGAYQAAVSALGDHKVRAEFPPSTAGDDFAIFSEQVPSCYVWLGNGPAGADALHHNTKYDFNDGAIATGIAFWTTLVERELPVGS